MNYIYRIPGFLISAYLSLSPPFIGIAFAEFLDSLSPLISLHLTSYEFLLTAYLRLSLFDVHRNKFKYTQILILPFNLNRSIYIYCFNIISLYIQNYIKIRHERNIHNRLKFESFCRCFRFYTYFRQEINNIDQSNERMISYLDPKPYVIEINLIFRSFKYFIYNR